MQPGEMSHPDANQLASDAPLHGGDCVIHSNLGAPIWQSDISAAVAALKEEGCWSSQSWHTNHLPQPDTLDIRLLLIGTHPSTVAIKCTLIEAVT